MLFFPSFQCNKISTEKQYFLPIEGRYLQQMESLVGLDTLHPDTR